MIQPTGTRVNLNNTNRIQAQPGETQSEIQDPLLDGVVVKSRVTFDNPISMEQLAKSMSKNADGTFSFNFGNIPGAHTSK